MVDEQVARISISIPVDLLRRFDDHIKRLGYESRSKAVQDALQSLITESKWMCEKMGEGIGAITMVYDHEVKGLEEELTDIQHRFENIIPSSMHIHLSQDNCLEIIAVKGKGQDVRDLAQELRTKKGVKHIKLAIVTP
ncbi:MAG: CopG family transcriptional regulator, nickel-responsive regulator [Thermoproteota archaeon]|nr:CopG family transcriptional regulator, nickel-responsive regulator [Thermoproteota archaeon]